MNRRVDVVICHWNNPDHLKDTVLCFKERDQEWLKFILIDNSSKKENLDKATQVLKDNVRNYEVIVRENKNKEAGAYWHYILNHDHADFILFTQEELHQYPMAPKGRVSSEENPFYPERYGPDGVELSQCCDWLQDNPKDLIGFGGHRIVDHVRYDKRWRTGYWYKRWKKAGVKRYDFFSGACFIISKELLPVYIEKAKPTIEDLENKHFAWMWERMWGTVPTLAGGRLVNYQGLKLDEVYEYGTMQRVVKRKVKSLLSSKK